MRIYITSVFVDDQKAALDFYTNKLGFEVKRDIPVGEFSWLTLTGRGEPDGPELLLEPIGHAAVAPYRAALVADGIPLASFAVDDIDAEFGRLRDEGVRFTQEPTDVGNAIVATLDDTCGNLVQLMQLKAD